MSMRVCAQARVLSAQWIQGAADVCFALSALSRATL